MLFAEIEIKEMKALITGLLLRVEHLEKAAGTHYVEPVVEAKPIGEPEPTEISVDPSKFLWSKGFNCWDLTFEFVCPSCKNATNSNLKVAYQHLQGAQMKFNCPLCKASLTAPITKVRG